MISFAETLRMRHFEAWTRATTHRFTGTVASTGTDGTFYVYAGPGREILGPLETSDLGTFDLSAPLFCGPNTVKLFWDLGPCDVTVVYHVLSSACAKASKPPPPSPPRRQRRKARDGTRFRSRSQADRGQGRDRQPCRPPGLPLRSHVAGPRACGCFSGHPARAAGRWVGTGISSLRSRLGP